MTPVEERGPLPKAAIDWLRKLGVDSKKSRAWWDSSARRAFRIAGMTRERLLAHFKDSLTAALERGESFETWRKGARAMLTKAGWLDPEHGKPARLALIHAMNVRTAASVGQWERVEESRRELPYLLYELGPVTTKHREEHEVFDGLVLPVDDPWWREHLPPRGFNCKCRVRALTETEAEARGVSKRPRKRMVTWKHPRSGRTIELPFGVEPGFEKHPAFDGEGAGLD